MQVGERRKRRKLADLKKLTHDSLQPSLQTCGLTPTTVSAVTDQGTPVTFEFPSSSSPPEAPQEPEDKTANILFLLDQFGVSDAFYHELAQVLYTYNI